MAFDFDKAQAAVERLPSHRHRLAFAAAIGERLLPNYEAFAREVSWGDPACLRAALDTVWRVVRGGTASLLGVREQQARIRLVTPDTEDFQSLLVSAALDACTAIHEALESCVTDDARRIAAIASLPFDTIDMYVQHRDALDPNDAGFEVKLQTDDLMVREHRKQTGDLRSLSRQDLRGDFVEQFRREARHDGKSSLGIA